MDKAAIFDEGVRRFNDGRYWDAHESWEELWLEAPASDREFFRGLIQIAAAYYHLGRANERGAHRLFAAGLRLLTPYPQQYLGADISDLLSRASQHQASNGPSSPGERPMIRLL